MKKFLRKFKNEYADKINVPLIKRQLEKPLHLCVIDVFKSLEATDKIKLLSYRHHTDEAKIDPSKYITTRRKNKNKTSKKDSKKKLLIKYDRFTVLEMVFKLSVKGEVRYKTVEILLPKPDESGNYTLKGKKYFLLYQLVNNSTYVTKNCIVLKGLMPLCISRKIAYIEDTKGEQFKVPSYYILNFKKVFTPLLFFCCKAGLFNTLEFYGVAPIFEFHKPNVSELHDRRYFFINNNMKVSVDKSMFDKHQYVQSVTCMIKELLTERNNTPRIEDLGDYEYWTEELGFMYVKENCLDVGLNTLIFFERLLDEGNKDMLKMYDINRKDVYSVTRTIIQNFTEFKKKDNNDLFNKRLRLNEYIASILSIRLGKSINRILSKGNKLKIESLEGVFKFKPEIIFNLLNKSPIKSYDDRINDMDFFSCLKYTIKGPNSIGNSKKKKESNVKDSDRSIHHSFVGNIDLDVCSSSSPGMGGLMTPYVKTHGLYFSGELEPQDSSFEAIKDVERCSKDKFDVNIDMGETYDEYIERLEWIDKMNARCKGGHGDEIYISD